MAERKKPFGWIPDAGWEDMVRLSEVAPDVFGSVLDDVQRNEKVWKEASARVSGKQVLSVEFSESCCLVGVGHVL